MLDQKSYTPPYGDISNLNREGLILKSLGPKLLREISNDYLNTLGTSSAIYEKNGELALGIFTSGWCRYLDQASRKLCCTSDNYEAIKSGKWLCHESCWTDASKICIEKGEEVDIKCHGGLNIFVVPIRARGKVIGAINFGYGEPPTDAKEIEAIATKYKVPIEKLAQLASNYHSCPEYVVDFSKRGLRTSAALIGEIVERKLSEETLVNNQNQLYRLVRERSKQLEVANLDLIKMAEMIEFSAQPFAAGYPDGKMMLCNQAFCELTGYSKEEIINMTWATDLTPQEWQASEAEILSELIRSGKPQRHEKECIRKDGSRVPVEILVHQVCDSKGEVKYYYSVITDISNRKKLEEALRSSEAKFRRAFIDSGLGMALMTLQGQFKQVNPALCDIVGYTEQELLARNFRDITHPQDLAADLQENDLLVKGDKTFFQLEKRYIHKLGHVVWVHLTVSLVHDDQGKPQYTIAQIQDITEKKNFEKEIIKLDRLNVVGQMAAGIGHEIRNPMTTVRGFLQLLKNKKEFTDSGEILDLMIDELDRANAIITEFLSLARNKPAQLKNQCLNSIIRVILPLVSADALKDDKYIEVELADIPELPLNDKEIRQILLNLVRNGLEAMDSPGGILTIKTYQEKDEVVLAIKDQGAGIPEDVVEEVGNPFFTTKENGTGLGLAICHNIVKRHGAIMNFETSTKGTTFYIRFKKQEHMIA